MEAELEHKCYPSCPLHEELFKSLMFKMGSRAKSTIWDDGDHLHGERWQCVVWQNVKWILIFKIKSEMNSFILFILMQMNSIRVLICGGVLKVNRLLVNLQGLMRGFIKQKYSLHLRVCCKMHNVWNSNILMEYEYIIIYRWKLMTVMKAEHFS